MLILIATIAVLKKERIPCNKDNRLSDREVIILFIDVKVYF
jgi:hypothetical protein